MKESIPQTLIHSPKDWKNGWRIARNQATGLPDAAYFFSNLLSITGGIFIPITLTFVGAEAGVASAAYTDIFIHQIWNGFPTLLAVSAIALLGSAGFVGGGLGGLAITPQGRYGRDERLNKKPNTHLRVVK